MAQLQALVYDILPSTIATTDYTIVSEMVLIKWRYVCNKRVKLYQAFLL